MNDRPPDRQYWWQTANKILTNRRLSYAFITGAALWLTWLASITFGSGNFDLAKQVVGTDYIQFYTAGTTLQRGNADLLYDFSYQMELEAEIAGPELTNFHAFLTPPFLAWLFIPFSMLPYLWSFLIWSIVGLIGLYASIKLLGVNSPWRTYLWTLCWFPIFAAISFGQNSLLSLLILSLTYLLWRQQRTFLAGLAASLMLFKPQLIIGLAILWIIRWRKDWKALLGLFTGAGIVGSLTYVFLPQAAADYVELAIDFLPSMIYTEQFPLYHLHALRGFWILLFPGRITFAEIVSVLLSLIGLGFYIRYIINSCNRPAACYAAAISITIFITPHAMIYDWALLLIPAILLWQEFPALKQYWKVIFGILWLVTLLSGPLTYLQLQVFPIALQISVPLYLFLLMNGYRTLIIQNSLTPSYRGDNKK
jgi:alpha-1,2-mannosyltransferase